jgi:hypothetical protein
MDVWHGWSPCYSRIMTRIPTPFAFSKLQLEDRQSLATRDTYLRQPFSAFMLCFDAVNMKIQFIYSYVALQIQKHSLADTSMTPILPHWKYSATTLKDHNRDGGMRNGFGIDGRIRTVTCST